MCRNEKPDAANPLERLSDADLKELFDAEWGDRRNFTGVFMQLPPIIALSTLSALQLALSHPAIEATGPRVAGQVRSVAEVLAEALGHEAPAIAEVIRRGWPQNRPQEALHA